MVAMTTMQSHNRRGPFSRGPRSVHDGGMKPLEAAREEEALDELVGFVCISYRG